MDQKKLLLEILAKNDEISSEAIQIMIDKLIELEALDDVLKKIEEITQKIEPFKNDLVIEILNKLGKSYITGIYENALILYKSNFLAKNDDYIPIANDYDITQKIELSVKLAYNLVNYTTNIQGE